MTVPEVIIKGERKIAHYEAIEYTWRIGKKAKSVGKFRKALHLLLWDISHDIVDVKELLDKLPEIPDNLLEALKS